MHTSKLMVVAAICVATAPSPSRAAAVRYSMPVWSMGNYNPDNPTNLTMTTASPRLAFKGQTLAEVKAKLDDGYQMFAQMCGANINPAGKVLAPLYNVKRYPSTGSIQKLFGDFCIVNNETKAVCVEFSDGDDGVEVKVLQTLYRTSGAANTDFMNVAADGKVTYKNYTRLSNIATGWQSGAYGAATLQLAKFVPSAAPMLVFPGATLEDVRGCGFSAFMGGASERHGRIAQGCNKTLETDGESGAVTAITIEFQVVADDALKCVVARFTDGEGGVHAQTLAARSAASESVGFVFSNGDGTYGGTEVAVSTGYDESGYGIYGLMAQKAGVYSTASGNVTSTASLVWPGVTLDDIKDDYLGCHFAAGNIASIGIEGRGCNRRITTDSSGSATNIRVEYQTRDGGKAGQMFVKCVVVDLTNGEGGVYAKRVGASYKAEAEPVGAPFVAANGSYSGSAIYNVYGLFAVPCIALEADEDWSQYGRQFLGDAVVDLNGHSLTAGELAFDTSRIGMVVNTAYTTTADMRFFAFEGGTISNDCVNVGNYCVGTDNIRLVKDGVGVYYAAKPQEYKSGTEVAHGILKPVTAPISSNSGVFGATSGAVTVDEGGVLDWNGVWNFTAYAEFILNGGTMQNGGSREFDTDYALLKKVTLANDSNFAVPKTWGLINSNFGANTLVMDGHNLGIDINSGKRLIFTNVQAPGTGRIEVRGAGVLEVRSDKSGTGFVGSGIDLWSSSELRLVGPMSVHDYEAAATKNGSGLGDNVMKVHGTFKPMTRYFRGVTMQDGSTVDFSEWPENAGWPVVNAYTCTGDKTIKFAAAGEGSTTTITVKLGDRKVAGGKVLAWASGNDISRVKFVRGDSGRNYALVKEDDGLYVKIGLVLFVK